MKNFLNTTSQKDRVGIPWSKLMIPIILIVMAGIFTILTPIFLTKDNIANLFRQTSITGIVAIGMTFIMIGGQIDLSVGSVIGLSSIITAMLVSKGMSLFPAILIALAASAFTGLVNGMVVIKGKIPAFIATMGTMTSVRGLVNIICDGKIIGNIPAGFVTFASTSWITIPTLFWLFLIVALLGQWVLTKTIFGRNLYAVGCNPEVARLSGIKVNMTLVITYILSSLLSGFAGILLLSRLASGLPTAGAGYEMTAITASVIGGTSLTGGEGAAIGTIFGALVMVMLQNGGNLIGMDSFTLQVITGIITIVAVIIDQSVRRKS